MYAYTLKQHYVRLASRQDSTSGTQTMSAVVAIDLGTSRSVSAFTLQGRAEDAILVRLPEGAAASAASQKTETAVLLSADNHEVVAFGSGAYDRYIETIEAIEENGGRIGADVGSRPTLTKSDQQGELPEGTPMLFRWFKMELCRQKSFQTVDDPVAISEGGHTLPLLTVMAAVLRHFKEDTVAYLSSANAVACSVAEIVWIVTIPAIYDDFARRFMRVAAHKAGLINTVDSRRLRLCLEPEAACLSISVKDAPDMAMPGTKTMIVDCGGGTVDITTHEVLSVNPLSLKELYRPKGGPWGSTFVDSEFVEWCKTFFGHEMFTRVRRGSAFLKVLVDWEDQKTRFSGTEAVRLTMAGFVQTEPDQPVFDSAKMKVSWMG